MKNIYIKFHHSNGDFHWKFLCVVLDNEALGILERMLINNQTEYKVEDRE